jgi:DNA modification methylase
MQLSQEKLAQLLGMSFVSVNRWERGASTPSPAQHHRLMELYERIAKDGAVGVDSSSLANVFASRGVRVRASLPLFDSPSDVPLDNDPSRPILDRITEGQFFTAGGKEGLEQILRGNAIDAPTLKVPPTDGMSAGKNTYTYDAHTYHTKVPPQGIAELLRHYLPERGLVLDPFSGSGMTGVAAIANGYDCILNELSPAACFISGRFVSRIDPQLFQAGVNKVLQELAEIRTRLYTTRCRECGKRTELLYAVWSYRVNCSKCGHNFPLWDCCRSYGSRVKEHKILSEFDCPACHHRLKKSRLKRTVAVPVQVGYKCCGSRQQEVTHELDRDDLALIYELEVSPPVAEGFFPTIALPAGVNLNQPVRHGLDRVDRFYTPRNLAAMSHLWRTIHRVKDNELAGFLAFVATSLYQRVTRLSEFRFWGGSGNSARFNVPHIFNESNVFITFARKARSIQDHLEATAKYYSGRSVVVMNSATSLGYLPDNSVDLIFTDPPFGANINYSDMNFLWESWLGRFTANKEEAIVNRLQGKGISDYRELMTLSLKEAFRVLRPNHWMLLVFMNSSQEVWKALRCAIQDAGFRIVKADIFDKQHGTFKQFVSENTAGCDLVFHCLKERDNQSQTPEKHNSEVSESVFEYLTRIDFAHATNVYLHVGRTKEIDFRKLFSEWAAGAVMESRGLVDFREFCSLVKRWAKENTIKSS